MVYGSQVLHDNDCGFPNVEMTAHQCCLKKELERKLKYDLSFQNYQELEEKMQEEIFIKSQSANECSIDKIKSTKMIFSIFLNLEQLTTTIYNTN